MGPESVFESMARILNRIEEIKRRFGIYPYNSPKRTGTDFRATLEAETKDKRNGIEKSGRIDETEGLKNNMIGEVTKNISSGGENSNNTEGIDTGGRHSNPWRGEISYNPDGIGRPEVKTKATKNTEGSDGTLFKQLENAVKLASEKFGLPEQLIKAVIEQESGFDPWAVSPKGAIGLMQLMPSTAEILGVKNPFDIYENILGGVGYLKILLDRYGGDLNKALAAYNAGPMKVKDNVPQIPETKRFIRSVIDSYERFMSFSEGDEF
ncbi:MAG: hypothetical protein DRP54_03720 [Spirochaetes bacterium]|nr:MAG: hypothetical protein DRP54_03720 [Spirochaetota bacterium]